MVNLCLDLGNSWSKIAVWQDDSLLWSKACVQKDLLPSVQEGVARFRPDNAILCSVVNNDGLLLEYLNEHIGNFILFSHQTPVPVEIAYRSPLTLGLDRIALSVAAARLYPEEYILVIALGSCITYNFIRPGGLFVGGNITPGVEMRFKAMHHFTQKLPLVPVAGECPPIGNTTETAIRSGVINGIVGEIKYFADFVQEEAGKPPVVLLTGGNGELITRLLPFKVVSAPMLLMEGLNNILRYNIK